MSTRKVLDESSASESGDACRLPQRMVIPALNPCTLVDRRDAGVGPFVQSCGWLYGLCRPSHCMVIPAAPTAPDASGRTPRMVAAVVAAIRASGMHDGPFSAVVNGARFPRLDYASACAIYEAARGKGSDASLVDDTGLELVRRTWGLVVR